MAKAKFLGLTAIGWNHMLTDWWHKLLAGLLLATVVLGTSYLLFLLYRRIRKQILKRKRLSKVPSPILKYLTGLHNDNQNIRLQRGPAKQPRSFGIYLGPLSSIPNPNQTRLLRQWDLIVLDPLQPGILDLVSSKCTSSHVIGRLDVSALLHADCSSTIEQVIRALSSISQSIDACFLPFTGVLLANWQAHFQPVVLNELIRYINRVGLSVYLELSPPTYLTEEECLDIDLEAIKGIAFRNGIVLPNGDRRNYFQMDNMRRAHRALARQSPAGGSTVMMWETIDDNAKLSIAVAKRTFNWCRFNNALSWIGSKAALMDVDIAATKTMTEEPLGAMMWLKEEKTIQLHETWRLNEEICQESSRKDAIYESLNAMIPDLRTKLQLQACLPPDLSEKAETSATSTHEYIWDPEDPQEEDPLSFSALGPDYTGLGCFQVGLECSSKDQEDLLDQQRKLRDSEFLQPVKADVLRDLGVQLRPLTEAFGSHASTFPIAQAIRELQRYIITLKGTNDDHLKVYTGLHSGFRTAISNQFWGLCDSDSPGNMEIYISAKTKDLPGTILHTFLSSKNCSRLQCFIAELLLSQQTGNLHHKWQLPVRLVQDIEQLSPSETILLLRQLVHSKYEQWCDDSSVLAARMRAFCEYQLIDVPSHTRRRYLNSTAYLRGEISAVDLVESRIAWYRERGCQYPAPTVAVALFNEIDSCFSEILVNKRIEQLSQIEQALAQLLQRNEIDAAADFFALSIFCACRKLALEEVYLEVLDRNPLPNPLSDQSACLAEMFATGSRCEGYFDVTPNVLGRMLSDKIHEYYRVHQPPIRDDEATELPTAYASKLVDLDVDAGPEKIPMYYQITFMGIFAVPAFIDIMLLTIIGRGLYLSTYMTELEKNMATNALMVSLFVTGAIGTWISSGGSYYLHSMAFPVMNMFVLTRYIAGVAVCVGSGTLAFVVIAIVKGPYAGMIFLLYFVFLTAYLTMLATLAIYQLPGFLFQSGRLVILTCIPILFISPVLTMWVGHDLLVYLCVLGTFLCCLILGARRVISQWGNWYLQIVCITDVDVRDWYAKPGVFSDSGSESSSEMPDTLLATSLPRKALLAAVQKERNRHFWVKSTTDPLVKKLANGYLATNFLMIWYCKYTRTKLPKPYSSTWNLQTAAGIDTLREMQKGLKLHNAFVHWRQAGDEVWCGVLYFVIALMDKWVALLTGGSIVGLSAANSELYRLAVGFGLASYLISAVFLDGIATPLWATANKNAARPIESLPSLRVVQIEDARARRKLYWSTLIKFACSHFYGVAMTSALMWSFEESRNAVIMYLAYMGAYTGLLWYQYNRIFTGPQALTDLLIGAACGLIVGPCLHSLYPDFEFSSVIALGLSTWTVAILSIQTARVGWPKVKSDKQQTSSGSTTNYSYGGLGPQSEYTQTALAEIFDSVSALPQESRFRLDPLIHPGVEIVNNMLAPATKRRSSNMHDAFRSASYLIRRTAEMWKSGEIVVDLIPAPYLLQPGKNMRTVSRAMDDKLHVFIFIGLGLTNNDWSVDIRRNCKTIAEALMQATAENKLGLSHDHSILAELLVVAPDNEKVCNLPEGLKHQLETSTDARAKVLKNTDKNILYYLLLGLDCDVDWDNLPEHLRHFFLKRCCGEPCDVSNEQIDWIRARFCDGNALDIYQHVSRCNLGAELMAKVGSFAASLETDTAYREDLEAPISAYDKLIGATYPPNGELEQQPFLHRGDASQHLTLIDSIKLPFTEVFYSLKICLKFIVVTLVADPEFQRELDYMLADKPNFVRWPVTKLLNGLWFFVKKLQEFILPLFLFHGRIEVSRVYSAMHGMKTVVKKDRVVIEALSGHSTCFVKSTPGGGLVLYQYAGEHSEEPTESNDLMAINNYTNKLVLREREEYSKKSLVGMFTYEYPPREKEQNTKMPMQRQSAGTKSDVSVVQYNRSGYITSGSYIMDDNMIEFKWFYRKNAKFEDELLRAEYVLRHLTIKVSWCVPPPKHPERLDEWLPNSKVTEATFIEGSSVYHCQWNYDHKFQPQIWTSLNGLPSATPPMVQHDHYHVLVKPKRCSFRVEDPLLQFTSLKTSFVSRLLGLNVKRSKISTSVARTHLWKSWKNSKGFDAVTARWLDEHALRSDRVLKPYWKARDRGQLQIARGYLNLQADTIMARTDVDPETSSWTLLAFKLSDLYSFGQGGDTTINTRTESTQIRDNEETLHVLAMDTGTWPNEGGGVSACRRDMINNLKSIRWHVLAENANDFGLPKFQVEKNVQSLTVLPLWGLDFLTPTHGVFKNLLDSSVQQRSYNTKEADIRKNFFPILETLVKCSRAINLTQEHLDDATKALVDLNAYFQTAHHWSDVWLSDVVKEKWKELWLADDVDNARPMSEWLVAERPTLLHLDQALDMWHRFLFIFSIPVPEKIPDVFQASHHFAGASYGVLCKALRNCTLHVWDHCISWREVTVFLSSAMSFDPPFVCTSLMHLSRLTSVLILTHADVVLPCADFFNPGWEQELGTLEGTISHRRTFARKIDPVVNGIANMERFKPIEKIKSAKPTVSMLSHVRFVKDIKNAILAADIIINDWGFEDYNLEIYGDMIKAPAYSVECQEIIAAKRLGKNVHLKGLGQPDKVLENAWLFLNCSVSEGLPLAMGEAALTGVPVVCTDVGASFRVVTDPATGEKFSAVVAPNDSLSLARAQINVLAMLDEWSKFDDDDDDDNKSRSSNDDGSVAVPTLPLNPTKDDARRLTQRMYDKTAQRRKLGMLGRANVLSSFSSDRYLREHEQMLWIGKYRSKSYASNRASLTPSLFSSKYDVKSMRGGGGGGGGSGSSRPPTSRSSSRLLLTTEKDRAESTLSFRGSHYQGQ